MSEKFDIAVNITLQHEGGFVDNIVDPGGATNFGITQADMPGQDMKLLTADQAVAYYREHYWKPLYEQINDQGIINKLFDFGVLFGIGEAAYLLQRGLNFLPPKWTKTFDEPTLLAVNAADPVDLLKRFKAHLTAHAINVDKASAAPGTFIKGWLRRIES